MLRLQLPSVRTFTSTSHLTRRAGQVLRIVRSTKSPIHRSIYEAHLRHHQSRLGYRGATTADWLAEGERDRDVTICPWHDSQFDLCSGDRPESPSSDSRLLI